MCRPCALPEEYDECMYDFDECIGTAPGRMCEVHCRRPYSGLPTIATCPAGNSDPNRELIWPRPQCSFSDCVVPAPLPDGYVHSGSGFVCDEAYTGVAQWTCFASQPPGCAYRILTFSGCILKTNCVPPVFPPEEECKVSTTSCNDIYAGDYCQVRCLYPYIGTPIYAGCPSDNADPTYPLEHIDHNCACPDPDDPAPGYEKPDEATGWRCAPGYTGAAVLNCPCGVEPFLSGCTLLVPCLPIDLSPFSEPCQYDVSDCTAVMGGESCQVACRDYYVGEPTTATCATNNTDPLRPLAWTPPDCTLVCPEPAPAPVGYALFAAGWACVPGYLGTAEKLCDVNQSTCETEVNLVGCDELVQCGALDVQSYGFSECAFDIEGCDSVGAGEACITTCVPPYEGGASQASCPGDNIQLGFPLTWSPPDCELVCDHMPIGYAKLETGWECATGWTGMVQESCYFDDTLNISRFTLSGCTKMENCPLPEIPDSDTCIYAFIDCEGGVVPGGSCAVECLQPYYGQSTVGTCPDLNTDATRLPTWSMPSCELICPIPDPMPAGYIVDRDGDYFCAPTYVGNVTVNCTIYEDCSTTLELTGCISGTECVGPSVSYRYDASECFGLLPTESCELKCKPPLVGTPTINTCPDGNEDPTFPLPYTLPSCSNLCDTIPVGYTRFPTGYVCNEGYAGTPRNNCTETDMCSHPDYAFELWGCDPIVPCGFPNPDPCQFNATDCEDGVYMADSCTVSCREPYDGGSTTLYCPLENTHPTAGLVGDLPNCSLECPDPWPWPEGYIDVRAENATEAVWRCAPTHVGKARKRCYTDARCGVPPGILEGCLLRVPCAPLDVEDASGRLACGLDAEGCLEPIGPGSQCELRCHSPLVGDPGVATCPAWNTNPARPASVVLPDCGCPPPSPMPLGYNLTESGFECILGWEGEVVENCSWSCPQNCTADPTCTYSVEISGCSDIGPCSPPKVPDPCLYDITDCTAVGQGGSCELRCRHPFAGSPTQGLCQLGDATRTLRFELPLCEPTCEDPENTTGYVRTAPNATGPWECADGYIGNVTANCTRLPNSCGTVLLLSGCHELVPCADLVSQDPCELNVSFCSSLAIGESCDVFCLPPYFGAPSTASCPSDNTDPMRQPDLVPLSCSFECPDPDPVPDGYVKTSEGWECDEEWVGNVTENCTIDTSCNVLELELTGCVPFVDCAYPLLEDTCRYMVSCACVDSPDEGNGSDLVILEATLTTNLSTAVICPDDVVLRGFYCEIKCQPPFVAGTSIATCPVTNTDPAKPLPHTPPVCVCPDPEPMTPGYQRGATGEWECAEGYFYTYDNGTIGSAEAECIFECENETETGLYCHNCTATLVLSGCYPLVPCAPLEIPDPCMHGTRGSCAALKYGQTDCEIMCNDPYVGQPKNASCPWWNIDPERPPDYEWPSCSLPCPDPDPVPDAYFWHTPIEYWTGTTSTVQTTPAPVIGEPHWACTEGYFGVAEKSCYVAPNNCSRMIVMSGCLALVDCVETDERVVDTCMFNMTECDTPSPPGYSCIVTCKAPYVAGPNSTGSAVATCPATNVDPTVPIHWERPECELDCPEPDVPEPGYAKVDGVWVCAEGYIGDAVVSCHMLSYFRYHLGIRECTVEITFDGCVELMPCVVPEHDACRFDMSACELLPSGGTCSIHCVDPYRLTWGTDAGMAFCPEGNTDPTQPIFIEYPSCELVCPWPDPMVPGYVDFEVINTTTGRGLRCDYDSFYEGDATEVCTIDPLCRTTVILAGCYLMGRCEPPVVPRGPCPLDISRCLSLAAGETCEIGCLPPCAADPPLSTSTAYCPTGQLPPGYSRLLQWSMPNCIFDCDPVPAGYMKVAEIEGWRCAEGYTGSPVESCGQGKACENELLLSGCYKTVPCTNYDIDPCLHSISYCPDGIESGDSCEIKCKRPLVMIGSVEYITCPADNLDPDRMAIWSSGRATHCIIETCSDPPQEPEGYMKREGEWVCDESHYGTPVRSCAINRGTCAVEAVFTGCKRLSECRNPSMPRVPSKDENSTEPPLADPCMFDWEAFNCTTVFPGTVCKVPCRQPWWHPVNPNRSFGYLTCPEMNRDYYKVADWVAPGPPECVQDCPLMGDEVGYAKEYRQPIECAENYTGDVLVDCLVTPNEEGECVSELSLTGCEKQYPCDPPDLSPCKWGLAGCMDLQAGESCYAKCHYPYSGTPTDYFELKCPENSTAPGTQPVWAGGVEPDCTFDDTCFLTDPRPSPPGSIKLADGTWICYNGYAPKGPGFPIKYCVLHEEDCFLEGVVEGCVPEEPCTMDERFVDSCTFDTDDCREVWPGSSCTVGCRTPYSGTTTTAFCPEGNVQRNRNVNWTAPVCYPDCPDPDPIPEGYVKDNTTDTGFKCDLYYQGTPTVSCPVTFVLFEDGRRECTWETVLSGCGHATPCAPYFSDDPCMIHSTCHYVWPGLQCQMSCLLPYTGDSVTATCPFWNVDPLQQVEYPHLPNCGLECSPSGDGDGGYVRLEDGSYICDEGYIGRPRGGCVLDTSAGGICPAEQALFALTGCVELRACWEDAIPVEVTDTCMYNFTACLGLQPGESCEVTCKQNFIGEATLAECFENNTDPFAAPDYMLPNCTLQCPDPADVPRGYFRSDDDWLCEPGYQGVALVACTLDDACEPRWSFAGCQWVVTTSTTTCVDYVPIGYQKTHEGWICAEGYGAPSTVNLTCDVGSMCEPEIYLGGCLPLALCANLTVDPCRYLAVGCDMLSPGEECMVHCVPPYAGTAIHLQCPVNNTNSSDQPEGDLPHCAFMGCPDPAPVPVGYVKVGETWQCAEGYTGVAIKTCGTTETCEIAPGIMSGCELMVPCRPADAAEAPEPCTADVSDCGAVPAGGSCVLTCREPFVPQWTAVGSVTAYCPENNTRPDMSLKHDRTWPYCRLECPEPSPAEIPENYTKVSGAWQCADGYAGEAEHYCSVDPYPGCEVLHWFSGCLALQPCVAPETYDCSLDLSDCGEVPAGSSCDIRCEHPFVLGADVSSAGTCPGDNTVVGKVIDWSEPWCRCGDPDPADVPPGYVQAPERPYRCDGGYVGMMVKTCRNPGGTCRDESIIGGCSPVLPCAIGTFEDVDGREGIISGTLNFGPAHRQGRISEDGVIGYSVFMANDCGEILGNTAGGGIAVVEATEGDNLHPDCCPETTYTAEVDQVVLEPGTTRLSVRIRTFYGMSPTGLYTPLTDLKPNVTTTEAARPVAGFAVQRALPAPFACFRCWAGVFWLFWGAAAVAAAGSAVF